MKMVFKIFVLLLIIMLTSCEHREKYEFIKRYLDNPENLEQILLSSNFDTEYFRKMHMNTELSRDLFIKWAERFQIVDDEGKKRIHFEVFSYYEGTVLTTKKAKIPQFIIYINNKENDFKLEFEWLKNNDGKWYLSNIIKKEKREEEVFD